jgi:hypothetical protein
MRWAELGCAEELVKKVSTLYSNARRTGAKLDADSEPAPNHRHRLGA